MFWIYVPGDFLGLSSQAGHALKRHLTSFYPGIRSTDFIDQRVASQLVGEAFDGLVSNRVKQLTTLDKLVETNWEHTLIFLLYWLNSKTSLPSYCDVLNNIWIASVGCQSKITLNGDRVGTTLMWFYYIVVSRAMYRALTKLSHQFSFIQHCSSFILQKLGLFKRQADEQPKQ